MVVEDRASGFCGDVVKWSIEAVTLRDRRQHQRHFAWKPGGFLLEGRPVTLRRPGVTPPSAPARTTASGSVAGAGGRARVAAASRIWVEGRHDAELLEHVWGDDLRDAAVVVEPMHGIDDLPAAVAAFGPARERRLGVLVDHLVEGSRSGGWPPPSPAPTCWWPATRSSTCGPGSSPASSGSRSGPTCRRASRGRTGSAARSAPTRRSFWPQLRNRVRTYADLRPELVGAVERLLDFVT